MESFKKVISLNQAAKISRYSQDYLCFLVRNGDLKGIKKGRTWFTTEEEIKNFLFKRKIIKNEFAIKDFFSFSRIKNIIFFTFIVFILISITISYFSKINQSKVNTIESAITSDGEGIIIKN